MVRSYTATPVAFYPVSRDDHFFYNIRWKLPAEFFFDDIKWLFLIETPLFTLVVRHVVACADLKKILLARYAISHLDPHPTFHDEAALGSESYHMSKKSHFAAGLENLAH